MNERVSKIINHPNRNRFLISAGLVFGTSAVAYGIGYLVARRKTFAVFEIDEELTLDIDVEETLTEAKETLVEKPPDHPPVAIIDHDVYVQKGNAFVEDQLHSGEANEPEPEVVSRNVFAGNDAEWDYELEGVHRSTREPYILHKDEFYADEKEYAQQTLTYYAGDSIMSDEQDKPIYNVEEVVGVLRFGHGSGDPNVFYVRNDKLGAEYEICLDPGLYSVEVLGLEIENNERAQDLKHTNVSKFRMD